jgi:DNA-binding transcriptional MerR regulator
MVALMTMPALSGGTSKKDISPGELSQRVAVIKRFKELLKAQRDRFNAYLNALDKQKDVIQSGTADDLLHHVELEEKIVSDIFSIQKVIDPLEEMYTSISSDLPAGSSHKSAGLGGKHSSGGEEISGIKEALKGLKAEAAIRSEQNRELLAKRMAELRAEINSIRSNAYTRRPFASSPAPSMIDLKG